MEPDVALVHLGNLRREMAEKVNQPFDEATWFQKTMTFLGLPDDKASDLKVMVKDEVPDQAQVESGLNQLGLSGKKIPYHRDGNVVQTVKDLEHRKGVEAFYTLMEAFSLMDKPETDKGDGGGKTATSAAIPLSSPSAPSNTPSSEKGSTSKPTADSSTSTNLNPHVRPLTSIICTAGTWTGRFAARTFLALTNSWRSSVIPLLIYWTDFFSHSKSCVPESQLPLPRI